MPKAPEEGLRAPVGYATYRCAEGTGMPTVSASSRTDAVALCSKANSMSIARRALSAPGFAAGMETLPVDSITRSDLWSIHTQ